MKKLFTLTAILFLSACAKADVALLMEEYLWEKRVLLIFTPSTDDELYLNQQKVIQNNMSGLDERDIVIWQFVLDSRVTLNGQTMPNMGTPPFYEHYNMEEARYAIILLGKDGEEKLRQNDVLTSQKLFDLIDAMPMRKREMQNAK